MGKKVKGEKNPLGEKAIDVTVNLHKRIHKVAFKDKARRAVREIAIYAAKTMKTSDVRIDIDLNKFVWSNGVRNVPRRVRVRLSRRKNDDENNAAGKFFTLVEHVPVDTFRGLQTEIAKN